MATVCYLVTDRPGEGWGPLIPTSHILVWVVWALVSAILWTQFLPVVIFTISSWLHPLPLPLPGHVSFPARVALALSMAESLRTAFFSLPCWVPLSPHGCLMSPPVSPLHLWSPISASVSPPLSLSCSVSPCVSPSDLFPLTPFRGWLPNANFPAHLQPLACAQHQGTLCHGGTRPTATHEVAQEEGGTSGQLAGEESARQSVTSHAPGRL